MNKVYRLEILTEEMDMLGLYSGTRSVTRLYFTTRAQAETEARKRRAEVDNEGYHPQVSVSEVDSASVPASAEIIGKPKEKPPKGRYIIRLRASDGRTSKTFTTVAGARAFAEKYLGKPDSEGRNVPDIYNGQATTDYGSAITIGGDLTWDLLYPELRRRRALEDRQDREWEEARERHERSGNPHVSRSARDMTLKARVNALVGRGKK
jgi:hypothetical protein